MSRVRVLTSDIYDPWFNLATEDWIFRDMNQGKHLLFLWRNQECVVIGKHQNPWKECNLKKMEEDGVLLVRRQSGGGAVFHDLGNTNFTFMSEKESYDKSANFSIITNALKSLGVDAEVSGRNDIVVRDNGEVKKISGSAFKEASDRCFHHGTLLINANLGNLGNYLNPSRLKLKAKGVDSVRSRVANISQLNNCIEHSLLSEAIIKEFFRYYSDECEIEHLDKDHLKTITSLNEYYEKLKDWDYRFGKSPKFSIQLEKRFEWGMADISLELVKGKVSKCELFSDSLFPEFIDSIRESLISISYSPDGLDGVIEKVQKRHPELSESVDELISWLKSEL